MRLLRITGKDQLSLVEVNDQDSVPYAILSHRWGNTTEEVSYQDLLDGTGKSKAGYRKILSCGKQALQDGLEYFWVDTCCIDKSSSAELSEAINSMWRWYRQSRVCYAYLNDVYADLEAWHLDLELRHSEWFKRGWTLQELLAPLDLRLYNESWEFIGTKRGLADKISLITGVDEKYLTGDDVEQASIAKRMSWASTRKTSRLEDIAYCLLGIFDINMPLLYGEGTKAFLRLQEEIIKRSDDQSIFAFCAPEERPSLLAESPRDFIECGNIVRDLDAAPVKPYAITNKGLQIELRLQEVNLQLCARLNCRLQNDIFSCLAIPLRHDHDNQYQRDSGSALAFGFQEWHSNNKKSMYITVSPTKDGYETGLSNKSCVIPTLPYSYEISETYPPEAWTPQTQLYVGIQDKSGSQRAGSCGLALISSRHSQSFLIMIFPHTKRHFRDGDFDARILPEDYDDSELADIFSRWKSRDLTTLPRAQQFGHKVLSVCATPMVVRDKIVTRIDVAMLNHRSVKVEEGFQDMVAFVQFTGHIIMTILVFGLERSGRLALSMLAILASISPSQMISFWGDGGRKHLRTVTQGPSLLILLFLAGFILNISVLVRKSKFHVAATRHLENVKRSLWRYSRNYEMLAGVIFINTIVINLLSLAYSLLLSYLKSTSTI